MSDAVYGGAQRYVSRQRLQAMLDHEWELLVQRLDAPRGASTQFFVFADTVAAKSFSRKEEGHGWLGVRFQTAPRAEPSEILVHARMWDLENARQQEALGILGVNLLHGAFFDSATPDALIGSLMDNLTRDRMEVDMIKFSGPAFAGVDNRIMSLTLVQQRLTNAVLFSPDGDVLEPAELLYRAPVLIERGSFRPVTIVTQDMLTRSLEHMSREPDMRGREPVVLMEMTVRNLEALGEQVVHADFLARVDVLRSPRPDGDGDQLLAVPQRHHLPAPVHRGADRPRRGRAHARADIRRAPLRRPPGRTAGGARPAAGRSGQDLRLPLAQLPPRAKS